MRMRVLYVLACVLCIVLLALPLSGGAEMREGDGLVTIFAQDGASALGLDRIKQSGQDLQQAPYPEPTNTNTATPGGATETPSSKTTPTSTETSAPTEQPTETEQPTAVATNTPAEPTATSWGPYPYPQPTATETPIPVYVDLFLPLIIKGDGVIGPTPTPTTPPGPCTTDIMMNGAFEYIGSWYLPITAYSAGYTNAASHSGSWSMRVGIYDPSHDVLSYSGATQTFYIPWDATDATLGAWLWTWSDEAGPVPTPYPRSMSLEDYLSYDVQYLLVLDAYDNWIDTLMWTAEDNQSWAYHTFDLTKFAGMTIKLHFAATNNGQDGVTGMFIDDATLYVTANSYCP